MKRQIVAPFAGAWIEILLYRIMVYRLYVAPFAGAWIEIVSSKSFYALYAVAPFAGAWIEITHPLFFELHPPSLPSRERGLKFLAD